MQTDSMMTMPRLQTGKSRWLERSLAGMPLWAWGILSLLFATLYFRVLTKLVLDWYIIPDFAHGFLIPFFCAYVLWEQRNVIAATPVRPSWAGVWLVLFGLLLYITGIYGAELFLARISGLMILAGLIWTSAAANVECGGGLQRHPLPDEPFYRGCHLRLPS